MKSRARPPAYAEKAREVLEVAQFGNPILRKSVRKIPVSEIASEAIQKLVTDMKHSLIKQKLGVALAAPQVGQGLSLVVVAIRPMPHRPRVKPFDMVFINPEIVEYIGKRRNLWEGCISSGSDGRAGLFAKVPRYPKVTVSYYDGTGKHHLRKLSGLKAHIIQHECDHLNGILFVDRVKDTKSFTTHTEYIRRIRKASGEAVQ